MRASRRAARRCQARLANIIAITTTSSIVASTLTFGGTPWREAPKMKSGKVLVWPAVNCVTTKSSIEIANDSSPAAAMPGAISGSVILRIVVS